MKKEEIAQKLHYVILDIVEEENLPLDESFKLIDDYGLDSMGFLSLSVQIQREFDITITSDEWYDIQTLGILISVVQNKMEKNGE